MPGDCGVSCAECGAVTRYLQMYASGRFCLNHVEGCPESNKMFPAARIYQAKNPSIMVEGIE